MGKRKNIVCVSNTTWYGKYTKSTVQLMSLLAKDNNVLFVEYPFTIKDFFDGFLKKKEVPTARMIGLKKRLKTIKINDATQVEHLVMPPMLPFAFAKNRRLFSTLLRINSWLYRMVLKRSCDRLHFDQRTIVNAYNPLYGHNLIGKLGEELHVYYCYDITETHRYGEHINYFETGFTKMADVVITSSAALNSKKLKLNTNSYTITNGVDFELFYASAKQKPNTNKAKKIGYVGSLDNRFDIDAIAYVITKLPNVFFEFTGNVRNKKIVERLSIYKNVVFHEPVPPSEVPGIMAGFDLGIIPYIMNENNKNIYPLKINEYLAIGLPVVITAFADLPEFKNTIGMASSAEEFLRHTVKALENDTTQLVKERIEFSRAHSWDKKAAEFDLLLDTFSEATEKVSYKHNLKLVESRTS